MSRLSYALAATFLIAIAATGLSQESAPLAESFQGEVETISSRPLLGIHTAEEWQSRRAELQKQLREMMGLEPLPERAPLNCRVTGTVERPEFVVEKLYFESRPGLFVTANLYRPKEAAEPLPAVLYVCGHAKVEKDGVIFGNKTHYQHHAAWFAANGYVCLVLDTLQLGELAGLHHGTYREGMWWWQSRGYTPAGVEAWNAIRAVDYLLTRPEVDPKRIGVTGRSGGGATSWWLGALDDRVVAVAPVAGITDLSDHVVEPWAAGKHANGVIEGHCDCMYFVNTRRWDFNTLAALVAPKHLLVENTVADPIFPEDGVLRIYASLVKVYNWYGARDKLDIVIGEGGHVDSPELRHAAFAFFERVLKGKKVAVAEIQEPDRSIPVEELKVLAAGETPEGCINSSVHETFVPKASLPPAPESQAAWEELCEAWMERLREEVFAGWPSTWDRPPILVNQKASHDRDGVNFTAWELTLAPGVTALTWVLRPAPGEISGQIVHVADQKDWDERWSALTDGLIASDAARTGSNPIYAALLPLVREGKSVHLMVPRGVGPSAWDPKKDVHIRRRFALVGQTLDGMRAWDVLRSLDAIRVSEDSNDRQLELVGRGEAASWVLWAAVFDPTVSSVRLEGLDATVRGGPAYLNLERIMEMPQAVALLAPRPVTMTGTPRESWSWTETVGRLYGATEPWPAFGE